VVVGEADGTQSELVTEQNGWLLPPGDWTALRKTLQDALSEPARLRRMGLVSYQIVRGRVNLEAMVAAFARAVELAAYHCGYPLQRANLGGD